MPDQAPRGDSRSHWWRGSVCLPRGRLGLALSICTLALFGLLVSAISPVDDATQPDFSRYFRNGRCNVTASNLLQMGHVFGQNRAAAITSSAHAGPVRHPGEHSIQGLPACANSPGFEDSLDVRAPPGLHFPKRVSA